MKQKKLRPLFFVIALALVVPAVAAGQGGGYQFNRGLVSSGGGTAVGNQGRYQVRGSIGQALAASTLTGVSVSGSTGFWWSNRDQDGDGMDDSWETDHGVDDPMADPDGDGLDNLTEYQAGTDPNRADSDGDGANDGTELDAGTDPLDPGSIPPGRSIYLPLVLK